MEIGSQGRKRSRSFSLILFKWSVSFTVLLKERKAVNDIPIRLRVFKVIGSRLYDLIPDIVGLVFIV